MTSPSLIPTTSHLPSHTQGKRSSRSLRIVAITVFFLNQRGLFQTLWSELTCTQSHSDGEAF